jgi:hypothetical protein
MDQKAWVGSKKNGKKDTFFWTAEAFQSLFSHTDGMGTVRMGAEGRW